MTVVASARTAVKDQGPLRGAPLVPRSTSLTASSLRLLSFHRGAGAPPFSIVRDLINCPLVLEVMPPQKNLSVAQNFSASTKGRPSVVNLERFHNSLRKERPQ